MPVLTLGKNFLSLCILMQKKKGMLVPFQEASINALQLAGITFLLETSSSLVAYVIHLNTADFTCDNYIISIYTYNASITPALDEQIRLPFVSFLLCSEPMLKVLSFFFFYFKETPVYTLLPLKAGVVVWLVSAHYKGRQSREINKITHRDIYADVFVLSQMLLLGSLGAECELHKGWAMWELLEGKMIIGGLAPFRVWLWFSLLHYQGHLSDFPPTVVPLFLCKETLIFMSPSS